MGPRGRGRVRTAAVASCWAAAAVTPVVLGWRILTTPAPGWDELGGWLIGSLFALWALVAGYGVQVDSPRHQMAGLVVYALLAFALAGSLGGAHAGYGLPLLLLGVFGGLAAHELDGRAAAAS